MRTFLSYVRHNFRHTVSVVCSVLMLSTTGLPKLYADITPIVKVENIRRIKHNGEHNSFTDLCRFKGDYYLGYRSCPDGHMVHPTSTIIIMKSSDTKNWKQVCRFNVPKRDVRDPHFLVFQNKLFVYTGTWYCGDSSPESFDMNEQLGYAVWSKNGKDWSAPIMLEGTYGHYTWRAAPYGGKAYLCGRRKHEFSAKSRSEDRGMIESAMLVSDDGLIFKTAALFQERDGDETAFQFEPDGSVVAVARRGRGIAEICRSKPPYTEWKRQDLDRYIGGPLLAKWDGRYVVGGRKNDNGTYVTSLYWLISETELIEFATLPSAGDNSYPGLVETGPKKALISWYSSHEKDADGNTITAVYLADLVIE